ncbi:MAG TPA: beta-ketoacyl synthase N-terminal-like domain-containing protein, partial [Polyangiaceae bacterium]|nr:beta-ketoacyl synthase N-terminal-like domain-containing protein [Polyangiaceae bacterium]
MQREDTALMVARLDVQQWREFYAGVSMAQLLDGMTHRPSKLPTKGHRVLRRLQGATKEQALRLLEEHVAQQLGEVLRLPASRLDANAPFRTLGLDSLMGLEIRNRLERTLAIKLPATVVWNYSSVSALAQYLAGAVPVAAPAGSSSGARALPVEPLLAATTTEAAPTARQVVPDAVAIVGVGCRYPGGASTPDEFWKLLLNGVDAISEVPADRWDVDRVLASDPANRDLSSSRWGGFIDGVDQFDADFFGISASEAALMDPQQRLLLEVAHEAIESAGQSQTRLAGSRTGVFVGIYNSDYAAAQLRDPITAQAYSLTGNGNSFAAGRLAYLLDLRGPAVALDTACSSSLVAVHLACQSLRTGETDLALAGGVSLMLSATVSMLISKLSVLSPDGRLRAFDAQANGFVRGEGCGVVVLKRLRDALRDGDAIWGIVRGSAVDQDGRSNGLTAPSGLAQQRVIEDALAQANLSGREVSYVEAHGTGTPLGDPIELEALREALKTRDRGEALVLGSVKANIGHLEAAAGVAGLTKVLLALQHRTIPPQINWSSLTPRVADGATAFSVPTSPRPWVASGPRRAGVSSFGMSGTNAHVVLEEAPEVPIEIPALERPLHLLCVSAKSQPALSALAERYAHLLSSAHSPPLADVAYSAGVGREHFDHRVAIVAGEREEAARQLRNVARGEAEPAVGVKSHPLQVAFLFTGQGSQYTGMGRELFETLPSFRADLQHCEDVLRPLLDVPLTELLFDPRHTERLTNTAYTQPALFSLEYALARVWQRFGIQPSVMMGHSVGEYAAACIAGVFSVEDGLKLISARGRLMQALPEAGCMVAVFASAADVERWIEPWSDQVAIASINAPANTVISGRQAAVDAVVDAVEARGLKTRRLDVSHAFHSPLIEPMVDEFERIAASVGFQPPRSTLISNLTGAVADDGIASARYWKQHTLQPVRFAQGTAEMLAQGCQVFLEIGPKPTLLGMLRQLEIPPHALLLPSLRGSRPAWETVLASLGALYRAGGNIDFASFDAAYARRKTRVPSYPFQRSRHWVDQPGLGGSPVQAEGGLLHAVTWRPSHENSTERGTQPARWVILGDPHGLGTGLARELERRGQTSSVLDSEGTPSELTARMNSAREGGGTLGGIVDLRALLPTDTSVDVACLVERNAARVLETSQLGSFVGSSAKLWLVTRGACRVQSSDVVDPAHAALSGLGLTLAHELSEQFGALLDVPSEPVANEAVWLAEQLLSGSVELQVALRK